MKNEPQYFFEVNNLSQGWAQLFLALMARGDSQWRAPVTLSIAGFENGLPKENPVIRSTLDETLKSLGKFSSRTCAMTIFPFDFWCLEDKPGIEDLTQSYLKRYLPRLKARDPQHNGRGVYFERMVAFQGTKQKDGKVVSEGKNQLQHHINLWRKAVDRGSHPRRSALQIAILDPVRDHTGSALAGFPCLQQLSLSYENDGLVLNAYYPTQYIFDRAYGNYLGLSHLGYFLAREIGQEFVRMNCTIVHPELGVTKEPLRKLQAVVEEAMMPLTEEQGCSSNKINH